MKNKICGRVYSKRLRKKNRKRERERETVIWKKEKQFDRDRV